MSNSPNDKFTPRKAAKFVAKSLIKIQVAMIITNLVDDNTSLDKDSKFVELGAGVVGWAVGDACAPVTDKIVDTAFDYVAEKRAERKLRKNIEENTKDD